MNLLEKQLKFINRSPNNIMLSICTSNKEVLKNILMSQKNKNKCILIESTSNQVNQYGGYTGLNPLEFKTMVLELAEKVHYPVKNIIFGGDHLGPLPWCDKKEYIAMKNAQDLIKLCIDAGYAKIHIDCSMKLEDDIIFDKDVIVKRTVDLIQYSEKIIEQKMAETKDYIHPFYVLGSEVPFAGGYKNNTNNSKTKIDFENIYKDIELYKKEFEKRHIPKKWKYVIAIVAQTGLSFGINDVQTSKIDTIEKKYDFHNLFLEAHSTDYQNKKNLELLRDNNFKILKIGPILTRTYLKTLLFLQSIENMLPVADKSNLDVILKNEMIKKPEYFNQYYNKTDKYFEAELLYSFSDRTRYYLENQNVQSAIYKLKENLINMEIPIYLVETFFPQQYLKIKKGLLDNTVDNIIMDNIASVLELYESVSE